MTRFIAFWMHAFASFRRCRPCNPQDRRDVSLGPTRSTAPFSAACFPVTAKNQQCTHPGPGRSYNYQASSLFPWSKKNGKLGIAAVQKVGWVAAWEKPCSTAGRPGEPRRWGRRREKIITNHTVDLVNAAFWSVARRCARPGLGARTDDRWMAAG
jgi:hypothetical protein